MNKKRAGENSIQIRHNRRRQKRIREQKIRRYTFFTVLAFIAALAVMFFTPFFNIKSVEVYGNSHVGTEEIIGQTGDMTGRNLFRTGKSGIKKSLYRISYIDKVTVKKKPFAAAVVINVIECEPIYQIEQGGAYAVVDGNGKVLEKAAEQQPDIPLMEGVDILSANEGDIIEYKDPDVQKIVASCIGNMKKADIIKDITVMSFADTADITFNYQSRLDVICGTHIDFQRKLALFKEAVNSNKLMENSRGTINLSTTGKAIYTP